MRVFMLVFQIAQLYRCGRLVLRDIAPHEWV